MSIENQNFDVKENLQQSNNAQHVASRRNKQNDQNFQSHAAPTNTVERKKDKKNVRKQSVIKNPDEVFLDRLKDIAHLAAEEPYAAKPKNFEIPQELDNVLDKGDEDFDENSENIPPPNTPLNSKRSKTFGILEEITDKSIPFNPMNDLSKREEHDVLDDIDGFLVEYEEIVPKYEPIQGKIFQSENFDYADEFIIYEDPEY